MEFSPHRVRLHMASQGFSQTSLSEKAGISRPTISTALAKGRANILTVYKIARALGVDVEQILDD